MIDFSRNTILFGGSFDPIHNGHLHVVQQLQSLRPQAKVLFVPVNQSPGKVPPTASGFLRSRWIELAGHKVWPYDLQRPGPSYTVELLAEAHRQGASRDHLSFVIGSDAYQQFTHWKNPDQIRQLAELIVVYRPGNTLVSQDPRDHLISIPGNSASSTSIRQALKQGKVPQDQLPAAVAENLTNLILQSKNPYAMQ